MSPVSLHDPEVYSTALKMLLTLGCSGYLMTGTLTLMMGHFFGLLTLPLTTALLSLTVWWMVIPVLPCVVLHGLAVRRVRHLYLARLRGQRIEN